MRILKKKSWFLACFLSAILCGCSLNSESDSSHTLLNESDVKKVKSIIETNYDDTIDSINLVRYEDGLPYIIINFLNNRMCYSLDGNPCELKNNYDVFISTNAFNNITDSVEMLCGNYNGYFISKEHAEYEIGELSNFYYDNFCPENSAYEAIATDTNGQMYFIADDCIIKMSGTKFEFLE